MCNLDTFSHFGTKNAAYLGEPERSRLYVIYFYILSLIIQLPKLHVSLLVASRCHPCAGASAAKKISIPD